MIFQAKLTSSASIYVSFYFLTDRSICFVHFGFSYINKIVPVSMFYHRQPATGVPGAVICSEGYRRMQELGGKRRETMIYTGSARRKVTAPYV